jgi:hypothetical protein
MRRRASTGHANGLATELQALHGLQYHDLEQRFLILYGVHPPRRIGREILLYAIAYRIQELALGVLSPSLRRLLAHAAGESIGRQRAERMPRKAAPGTPLIRQWRGVTHQVSVLEDGVLYRGERSLSERGDSGANDRE